MIVLLHNAICSDQIICSIQSMVTLIQRKSKYDETGLIIRKFMWNLRGTKCQAQPHNKREAVVVWVSPVAAKRQ